MEAGNGTAVPLSSRNIVGRKERSDHVWDKTNAGGGGRRQYSITTLGGRMRSWWSRRNQTSTKSPMIPDGLSLEERAQYETLLKVVAARPALGVKTPRVIVITDLAKDYDDLAAMVVLKELHRLGVVTLLGFVANLMPQEDRVRFGRGALDLLGLHDIPIAQGTSGFPPSAKKKHTPFDYEFKCDFMADENDERIIKEGMGEKLLHRLFSDAVATKQKLTLVLISSLEDIYAFSTKYTELFKEAVSNIVFQGGYSISPEGNLIADPAANNNRYDIDAAREFHNFIQESGIPSVVYTKVAAFATPLTSVLFDEMAKTHHPLGKHLRHVQVFQDLAFYTTASKEKPEERFAPFMDRKWFLENKTSWFDKNPPDAPYPNGKEVVPYLTKVIVYDALAGLGASGQDALDALEVLTPYNPSPPSIHRVVGFAGPPSDPGVHPDQMALIEFGKVLDVKQRKHSLGSHQLHPFLERHGKVSDYSLIHETRRNFEGDGLDQWCTKKDLAAPALDDTISIRVEDR